MKSQSKVVERLIQAEKEELEILYLVVNNGMSIEHRQLLRLRLNPLIDTLKWSLENFNKPEKIEHKLQQLYDEGYRAYYNMVCYGAIEYEHKCIRIRSKQKALEFILDIEPSKDNSLNNM